MIEILNEHIQNLCKTYQSNGIDMSLVSSYLKDENVKSLPDESVQLILAIPTMLSELTVLMKDSEIPAKSRALASGVYSYVFNPIDYIPDDTHSIFGFLDDALILYYSLQFIGNELHKKFEIINTENDNFVQVSENLLSDEIVKNLKNYPSQVNLSIHIE